MEERHFGPVRFLPGPNNGKYPYCHSVFIEGAGILIDPSSDRQRLEALRDTHDVNAVWLSHWHEDHFMHLDLFDDVPLAMHAADASFLENMETFLDGYGIEDTDTREAWKPLLEEIFHFRPRQPDMLLEEKEGLSIGDVTVDILHTPGHTPGHLCVFFHEPEVLFLADYDLTAFGPWYGDRLSSIAETEASVRRLQGLPARVWLTCHETGVFEAAPPPLWDCYLDVIRRRRADLLALLAKPRSMSDIVDAWIVYKRPREPLAFYRHAEQSLMEKHLEELMTAGRVVQEGRRYRRT
ncbi:MAG: MBL fold metallo-hydrolase [Desulfobacteraceae bacterium]|nr:MBL fold metallo-hydrolase [Desulfobacteraceae bacterium]MBC2751416.1 MBL fold metallo-hydrolase [Desulfobacteraceae bacterium]